MCGEGRTTVLERPLTSEVDVVLSIDYAHRTDCQVEECTISGCESG